MWGGASLLSVGFGFLLLLSESAHAQRLRPDSLKRGTEIRVSLRDSTSRYVKGRIDSIAGDTIMVLVRPDSLARLSVRDVASLEAYVRNPGGERVMQVFFGVGAVAGAYMYLSWCAQNRYACQHADDDPDPYDDEKPTPMWQVMTLGTGAITGLIGYAFVAPRWEQVSLPVRVGVIPTRGGRGVLLYASLRW